MVHRAVYTDIQRATRTSLYHGVHTIAHAAKTKPFVAEETNRGARGNTAVAACPGLAITALTVKDDLFWTRFCGLNVSREYLLLVTIVAEYGTLASPTYFDIVATPRCRVSAVVNATTRTGDEIGIVPRLVPDRETRLAEPAESAGTTVTRTLTDAFGTMGSTETMACQKRSLGRTTIRLGLRVIPPIAARGPV